ncbi:hypothetical protein NLI96_g10723 [Meripilus lineatus]|uniref:Peptidase A1 domain-containing protein n=1 Tax=Meripilus lineatus TaxID=2056292 RepID=A0AAD5UVG6_9APHY|nr:hypothetical protein NLI96_g10723 [Physisporinus lineatus]
MPGAITSRHVRLPSTATPVFNSIFERDPGARETIVRRAAPITLQSARRLNLTSLNLLQHDQARARQLEAIGQGNAGSRITPALAPGSIPATNAAVDYTVSIGIGTPPTQCTEFTDRLTIGSNLVVVGQSIGVAAQSEGFDDVDGVLGLGPQGLSRVTDSLFTQAAITQNLVAISFQPTNSLSVVNGELTFGGTDSSQFVGSINFAPITGTSPSSRFFGINQAIRYGSNTNILSNSAGIFDTFTTLTMINTAAFGRYKTATGGVIDNATTLLKISPAQFNNLQSLFFTINNVVFEFTANAQLWPRALNTAIGGDENSIYLIIADIGSGSSFNFINGYTFLERFYTVYDTQNRRVGIANTPFTRSTIN